MFRQALVRELAVVLLIKLAVIWALWFAFFRAPVAETDPGDLFADGPAAIRIQPRSAE